MDGEAVDTDQHVAPAVVEHEDGLLQGLAGLVGVAEGDGMARWLPSADAHRRNLGRALRSVAGRHVTTTSREIEAEPAAELPAMGGFGLRARSSRAHRKLTALGEKPPGCDLASLEILDQLRLCCHGGGCCQQERTQKPLEDSSGEVWVTPVDLLRIIRL